MCQNGEPYGVKPAIGGNGGQKNVMSPSGSDSLGAPRGIWAAVPTPFSSDGGLDLAGVRHNARIYADRLGIISGIFCNGLMGEGWSLDLDERRSIVDTLQAETGDRLAVGVVITHHSFAETIALARHARSADVHHIVLIRPRGPFSDDELRRYVISVREAADLPIILFEGPAGLAFGAGLVQRLADESAIAGVKATAGLEAAISLRQNCGDRVPVMDPLEANWLMHIARFGVDVLYADPEPYLFQSGNDRPIARYFAAYRNGNLEEAWRISATLERVRAVYDRWIMQPLRRGVAPNAALKAWCRLMGLASGPVRAPLTPLSTAERRQMEEELRASGAPLGGHDQR